MSKFDWVRVDLEGLAKTLGRNGKNLILSELLRNAWDETGVTEVVVSTSKMSGEGTSDLYRITVSDDSPDGFRDLADAYTLFAESYKKDDVEKAGRFNAGEKFVLALCESARIQSTSGTMRFNAEGRHEDRSETTKRGTVIDLFVKMTDEEHEAMMQFADTLIAPPTTRVLTTINGKTLGHDYLRVAELRAFLTTERTDDNGILRRSKGKTRVHVYRPLDGEPARLYELGIPVQEIDCKWHIDVQQKVPLTLERDAVPPSFLREVHVLLLNELVGELTKDDAAENWVRDGAGSRYAHSDAVEKVMDLRFGTRRVAYDPSDPEANRIAVSKGYTVVSGGSLSREEWRNVKAFESIKPAGQVTPSYNPYSKDGRPAEYLPESDYSEGMRNIVDYIETLGRLLLQRRVRVMFETGRMLAPFSANYGKESATFTFNYDRCGRKAFDKLRSDDWLNGLIIHEFAHDKGGHLTESFEDALSDLGAKLTQLALQKPTLFYPKAGAV